MREHPYVWTFPSTKVSSYCPEGGVGRPRPLEPVHVGELGALSFKPKLLLLSCIDYTTFESEAGKITAYQLLCRS